MPGCWGGYCKTIYDCFVCLELRDKLKRRKEIISLPEDVDRAVFTGKELLESNPDNLVEKEVYGVLLRYLLINGFVDSLKAVGEEEHGESEMSPKNKCKDNKIYKFKSGIESCFVIFCGNLSKSTVS